MMQLDGKIGRRGQGEFTYDITKSGNFWILPSVGIYVNLYYGSVNLYYELIIPSDLWDIDIYI